MVSISLDVDGKAVGVLDISNITGEVEGSSQYEWTLMEEGKVYMGFVMHKHEDGILRLIERTVHEVLCEKRFQEAEVYNIEGAKELCGICKRELNNPEDLTTKDCGGDCLRCMAEAGDTDCEIELEAIEKKSEEDSE